MIENPIWMCCAGISCCCQWFKCAPSRHRTWTWARVHHRYLGLIIRCSSFDQWWQLRRQKPSLLTRKGWTVGLSKLGWWHSDRAIGEPTHQDWGWAWVCFEAMCSQTQKEAQLSAVSSFPAPDLEEELSGNYIARKNHCPQIKDIFVCYQGLRV